MSKPPRIDPLPESEWDEETRSLIEQNWEGPPPGNANNLFRTFAKRVDLFRPWSEFALALYKGHLSERDREILILRIAYRTQSRFEWAYHAPLARHIGMTREEIERVIEGPEAAGWHAREATLLRVADELHETQQVGDDTWAKLAGFYDEDELIEIALIVGGYTLVAHFTNALRIAPGGRLPEVPAPSRGSTGRPVDTE